ncbi:DsbA family protein [Candidatus Parcubacteria bacterium]|nr:MAG: DsbA family protein [Candidatus Parcubacteria bacterium]
MSDTDPQSHEAEAKPNLLIPGAIVAAGLVVAGAIVYSGGLPTGGLTATPTPPSAPPAAVDMAALVDDDPMLGDPNAPVTIVEFSDFECPFCNRFWLTTLPLLRATYIETGKARLVYRDFPLSNIHANAAPAAEAAQCAHEQGKFWEFHDRLFENQAALGPATYRETAAALGLNTAQFDQCVSSGKYRAEVQNDFEAGRAAGVSGTPTFYINGIEIVGALPYSEFEQAIEAALANAR